MVIISSSYTWPFVWRKCDLFILPYERVIDAAVRKHKLTEEQAREYCYLLASLGPRAARALMPEVK